MSASALRGVGQLLYLNLEAGGMKGENNTTNLGPFVAMIGKSIMYTNNQTVALFVKSGEIIS
jgi:hypothetical protein